MTTRDHYIPRFLLRRFAFRATKKGSFLWQFRPGKGPIQVETKNAGVESLFYGDSTTGVESGLSKIETQWAALLNWLDDGGDPNARSQELWRFAWTLGIRTRALREETAATTGSLLRKMAGADSAMVVAGALRTLDQGEGAFWEEAMKSQPPAVAEAIQMALRADPSIKERLLRQIRELVIAHAPSALRTALNLIAARNLSADVANGQIQGLTKLLAQPSAEVDKFAPPHWSVLRFGANEVVLGDVVTFTIGPQEAVGATARFKADLEAIYVPISHERVLVGSKVDAPALALDAINRASAGLSREALFTARNTQAEAALAATIGSIDAIMSESEKQDLANDAWRDLGTKPHGEA